MQNQNNQDPIVFELYQTNPDGTLTKTHEYRKPLSEMKPANPPKSLKLKNHFKRGKR